MKNSILNESINFIRHKSILLKIDSIRATTSANSGHPTSCLSCSEIVATIFFYFLKFNIAFPKNSHNDRFITSKGHAIPIIYAAWKHLGVITDECLLSLRSLYSKLEGHPTPRFIYNDAATGSLGNGLGIAVGIALSAFYDKLNFQTYVLLGDGELTEGSNWEAIGLASHCKLSSITAFLDCNKFGQSGVTIHKDNANEYKQRFLSFGWHAVVVNGHCIESIIRETENAINKKDKPTVIIVKTKKGYEIKEIDKNYNHHGKPLPKEIAEKVISRYKKQLAKTKDSSDKIYIPLPVEKDSIDIKCKTTNIIKIENSKNSNNFTKDKNISTRKAFGHALEDLGEINKDIFVVDADVKNSTFSDFFSNKFPERFVQCFIAEQTMVNVAIGLHSQGKIPFVSTFAAFLTRAFDQIRMAAIGQTAIRICGSHAGVSIGQDGPSQMGLEDIAMFATVPQSIILYPSDGIGSYKLVQTMADYNCGISYLRTTRSDTPIIYNQDEQFPLGSCKVLRKSNEDIACVIGAGITLHEALKAYEILKQESIYISVIDAYSVKPLDTTTIFITAKKSKNNVVVVEDHYAYGGLCSIVAKELVNKNINIAQLAVENISRSGSQAELLSLANIDATSIANTVKKTFKNNQQ